MKLSELVFETNIVKEELDIRTQGSGRNKKVTVFDTDTGEELKSFTGRGAEGQAEEFRDAERAKQKAPATDTKKPTKTPKATSGKLTPGLIEVGGKWQQIMPDGETILEFNNQKDAENVDKFIQKKLADGKSPKSITQMFTNPKKFAEIAADLGIPKPKISSGSKIAKRLDFFKNQSWTDLNTTEWAKANPKKMGMLRKLSVVGDIAGIWVGCMFAIDQVKKEMQQPGADVQALELEAQILAGQAYLSLVAVLIPFLKVGAKAKALVTIAKRAIQWGIAKTAGAATVATGGAAAPVAAGGGLAAILAVEGLSALSFFILAQPSVQRYIAQLIAGSIFEDVFAGAGAMGNQAITNMDKLLDGKYGSGFLKRTLTTDTITKGGVEGEYYSDSEWAKKVFGALLFPEGEESRLVPYISVSKREDLMNNILGVETGPQLSSRLDSKGETPTQQTPASGNLSSRLDTKGETPGRPTSYDDMTQQDFVKQAQKMSPGG